MFLRFCLCIFESGTVKSDCPLQIFRKMMKYIKIKYSFTSFYFSGDKKKKKSSKKKKKSSENDQFNWSFSELFYLFFFVPPTLDLKKNPVNQLIRKFWPYDK